MEWAEGNSEGIEKEDHWGREHRTPENVALTSSVWRMLPASGHAKDNRRQGHVPPERSSTWWRRQASKESVTRGWQWDVQETQRKEVVSSVSQKGLQTRRKGGISFEKHPLQGQGLSWMCWCPTQVLSSIGCLCCREYWLLTAYSSSSSRALLWAKGPGLSRRLDSLAHPQVWPKGDVW